MKDFQSFSINPRPSNSSMICEHCCAQIVGQSHPAIEEVKEICYVGREIIFLFLKYLGFGLMGVALILVSLFPSVIHMKSPAEKEEERRKKEERRRAYEEERRAEHEAWEEDRRAQWEYDIEKQRQAAAQINLRNVEPVRVDSDRLLEDDKRVREFNNMSERLSEGKEDPWKVQQAASELIAQRDDIRKKEEYA